MENSIVLENSVTLKDSVNEMFLYFWGLFVQSFRGDFDEQNKVIFRALRKYFYNAFESDKEEDLHLVCYETKGRIWDYITLESYDETKNKSVEYRKVNNGQPVSEELFQRTWRAQTDIEGIAKKCRELYKTICDEERNISKDEEERLPNEEKAKEMAERWCNGKGVDKEVVKGIFIKWFASRDPEVFNYPLLNALIGKSYFRPFPLEVCDKEFYFTPRVKEKSPKVVFLNLYVGNQKKKAQIDSSVIAHQAALHEKFQRKSNFSFFEKYMTDRNFVQVRHLFLE